MTPPAGTATRRPPGRRRPRVSEVLFRRLPGDSVVHRLWAGTKLICVAILSLAVAISPSWPVIGAVAVLVLTAAALARIPASVIPRPPVWLLASLAIGLLLSLAGGGLSAFARVLALSLLFTAASAVITWTTAPAELGPAIARLGAPLRRLCLPVDDYARTVALSVRCLPLLTAEVGTLLAARRLRRAGRRPTLRTAARELGDLLTATVSVTIRRADELGEAVVARGGIPAEPADSLRPGPADAVTILVVAAGSVSAALLGG